MSPSRYISHSVPFVESPIQTVPPENDAANAGVENEKRAETARAVSVVSLIFVEIFLLLLFFLRMPFGDLRTQIP
jgi:hypothetical protein